MNIWKDEGNMTGCQGELVIPTDLQELVEVIEVIQHRGCEGNNVLDTMLEELNRHILDKLGSEGCQGGEEEPLEFQTDPTMTAWVRGSELASEEDIIACWYLSDAFPWGMDFTQMVQIQRKLKEQMQTLEAEEAEYEELDDLDLWRFRRDIKAEQLEQIQTMMHQYSLDSETW